MIETLKTKEYIAKFVPVPGEPEVGDFYQIRSLGLPSLREAGIYPNWTLHKFTGESLTDRLVKIIGAVNKRKVKLYLCSEELVEGSTIIDNVGRIWENTDECFVKTMKERNEYYKSTNPKKDNELCLRIIGLISPKATWIQEGDKIYSDQIMYLITNLITGEEIIDIDPDPTLELQTFAIFNPSDNKYY